MLFTAVTWRYTRPHGSELGARRRQKNTKRGGRRSCGEVLSKKTWKRWVLAGMEPAGSPVIARDGDFSSPDAPRGTSGPKSKFISQQIKMGANLYLGRNPRMGR